MSAGCIEQGGIRRHMLTTGLSRRRTFEVPQMKRIVAALTLVLAVGTFLGADLADARRLGGGRSMGAQRQMTPPPAPAPNAPSAAPSAPASPSQAVPGRPATPAAAPAASGASR